MIYYGSSNHFKNKLEQKTELWTKSKWPPSMNLPYLSQLLCISIENFDLEST
jgi:hypothetical protein